MAKPELSDPITLRLPMDVLSAVEAIGAASDRTRSWVIVRALKSYLATEGAEILAVAKGLEDMRAGNTHEANAVLAEIEELLRNKVA